MVVAKHNFGGINAGKTLRAYLTGFVTVAEGTHEIRFRITRPYTQNAITPTQFIDNIYIGSAKGPGQPPASPEPDPTATPAGPDQEDDDYEGSSHSSHHYDDDEDEDDDDDEEDDDD